MKQYIIITLFYLFIFVTSGQVVPVGFVSSKAEQIDQEVYVDTYVHIDSQRWLDHDLDILRKNYSKKKHTKLITMRKKDKNILNKS